MTVQAGDESRPEGVSRRDFLKGAVGGLVVGGVAAGVGVGYWPKGAAQSAGVPSQWDKEADVVVLGSGTASIGAITAHDAGAKVLILEKGTYFGGHTSVSGGALWVPNNFVMQQAGIADSKEDALKYLQRVSGGQSNDELMNAYLDNAPQMVVYLRDKVGFQWQPEGWSPQDPKIAVFGDYYPQSPGGRVRGRSISYARPATQGGGAALMDAAKKAIDARGIEVMLSTPGKRLVTNANGEVIGVIAESNGKEISVKARRAILIGTGGFERNKEMTLHFLRGPVYFSCGAETNEGDGHRMGMAIGADLRNMNEVWGFVGYNVDPDKMTGEPDWSLWRGKPGAIIVNKYGQRIGNESAPYDLIHRAFQVFDTGSNEWRNIPSFTIVDSEYAKRYTMPGTFQPNTIPSFVKKYETLDALAKDMSIVPSGLAAAVQTFNQNARNGVDPDWHRGESSFDKLTAGDVTRTELKNPCLAPLETPPFYATQAWPGCLATNGGLRTNGNAQVLDVFGQVIPRLYCTGNAMASVMGIGYAGGGATIGPGTTFAYVAARHGAALKPWE